jgi:hypothetical protein
LSGVTGDSEIIATAYVSLRNAIEHHGGIPRGDIALRLKRFQLITSGGTLIGGPMILEAGEGISLRVDATERVFKKG